MERKKTSKSGNEKYPWFQFRVTFLMQFDKDDKCKSSIVMQFIKEFTAKGF